MFISDVSIWPRPNYILPPWQGLNQFTNPPIVVVEVADTESHNHVDAKARRYLSNSMVQVLGSSNKGLDDQQERHRGHGRYIIVQP